jgi:hypothetical protein
MLFRAIVPKLQAAATWRLPLNVKLRKYSGAPWTAHGWLSFALCLSRNIFCRLKAHALVHRPAQFISLCKNQQSLEHRGNASLCWNLLRELLFCVFAARLVRCLCRGTLLWHVRVWYRNTQLIMLQSKRVTERNYWSAATRNIMTSQLTSWPNVTLMVRLLIFL